MRSTHTSLLAGGDITALNDLDAVSAMNPYIALAGGDITALNDLDAVSAINPYIALAGGDITATGDLDSVSAVDTFFGDGPEGAGGVFTGGGIDALAPDADGNGGYAALSALPVFAGPNRRVRAPGGVEALANYDALSAIPAYLATPAPAAATALSAAPEGPSTLSTTSTPSTGSGPVRSFVNAVTSALPGGGGGTGWTPSTQGGPVRSLVNAVSSALPKPMPDNSSSGSRTSFGIP